jgi:hypothetical protein
LMWCNWWVWDCIFYSRISHRLDDVVHFDLSAPFPKTRLHMTLAYCQCLSEGLPYDDYRPLLQPLTAFFSRLAQFFDLCGLSQRIVVDFFDCDSEGHTGMCFLFMHIIAIFFLVFSRMCVMLPWYGTFNYKTDQEGIPNCAGNVYELLDKSCKWNVLFNFSRSFQTRRDWDGSMGSWLFVLHHQLWIHLSPGK